MLSFNQALKLLKSSCQENIVKHCLIVSEKSYELAKLIKLNNLEIDAELCRIGGLLHDIGRSVSHDLNHGVIGAKMLEKYPKLSRIALTHVGGGIPKDEAIALKLSNEDLTPKTLEEKVVCYADKLVHGDRLAADASEEIVKLEAKLGVGHASIKRIKMIEDEINKLIKKI
ncbi:MAG: HDIG domain-containing protein [Candidatus Nanoarchaeia archaeon]|nr:HDIG domain-containing protein [Candidatus Nanoarchaeia archaeon]